MKSMRIWNDMTGLWPWLKKDSPESRSAQVIGKIERVSVANGLHSYYSREAA